MFQVQYQLTFQLTSFRRSEPLESRCRDAWQDVCNLEPFEVVLSRGDEALSSLSEVT